MKKITTNYTSIKKIILIATISSVASLASASPLGSFYVKVGGGVNMMAKHKGKAQVYKSTSAGLAEIGVGYSLLDNVRADLTFTHYFNPKHKASSSLPNKPNQLSGNLKSAINTYMINGYVDITEIMAVKLFVGGGVGLAQVKQKYANQLTNANNILIRKTAGSTKKANNLSYSLTAGVATSFTPIVDFELAYAWHDFGKTKSKNHGPTTHYKGHNVIGRLRFSI